MALFHKVFLRKIKDEIGKKRLIKIIHTDHLVTKNETKYLLISVAETGQLSALPHLLRVFTSKHLLKSGVTT